MASEELLKDLNPPQKEAVKYTDGPLLIIAGPGTGKTRVLIEKVLYLIQEKRIKPNKILVSTFTVKAAEELKDRLRLQVGNKVETMQISTIHSFCQTMLEEFSEYHRLGAAFNVLDEEDQYIFIKSRYAFTFGLKDYIKPYEISTLINTFNKLSENNIDPDKLIEYLKRTKSEERNIKLVEAYKKYLLALRVENLVDFSNLQKEFLYIIENNNNVLEKVQQKYDYILIDEYQDTNPIQDKIFSLIAKQKKNICVVGDEDQSIYGFRGALVENFRNFAKKYENVKIVKLEENFRSGKQIVDLIDSFMRDHRKYPKKLFANRGNTNKPLLIRGETLTEEAKSVVKLIKRLKEENKIKHYGDVAILFRSVRNHSNEYVQYLKKEKIPYYVIGDGAFLSRDEVRTILYLMAFVEGFEPNEKVLNIWRWWSTDLLLNNVLNLTDDTKQKISKLFRDKDFIKNLNYDTLNSLSINKSDLFLLLRLVEKREKLIKENDKKKKYSLTRLFYDVLKITGYLKRIIDLNDEESEIQKYNLGLLSNIIYKFETTTHNNNFKHFFDHLFYLPDDKAHSSAFIEDSKAVKLMTVHQAKGLEFPVVVLGSVTKGRFPSQAAKREDDFFRIPEEFALYNQKYDALEEERRLFYVGMTRAQDLLVIATTDGDGRKPSEYITEEIGIIKLGRPEEEIIPCEKTYEEPDDIPRLSYSSINNFISCPFRYGLNYKYKFQTPPTFFQNYGTVVHNTLQKIHLDLKEGKELTLERIKEIVRSCWIPIYFDKRKDDKMMFDLIEKIWNYVRKGTQRYEQILEVEKPFSFIGKDFIIRGKVDLITKDKDGTISITDFKSRNIEGLKEDMLKLQLRMYCLALENEFNVDNIYGYAFQDNYRTPFNKSKEELNKTKEIIINVGQDIKNERFKRNLKSKFCKTCMYSFLCY